MAMYYVLVVLVVQIVKYQKERMSCDVQLVDVVVGIIHPEEDYKNKLEEYYANV